MDLLDLSSKKLLAITLLFKEFSPRISFRQKLQTIFLKI